MVYIELVFAENFFIDFVLMFFASSAVGHISRKSLLRLCASAALGGLYSLAVLFVLWLELMPFKLLTAAAMSLITAGFTKIKTAVLILLRFLLLSFLTAGIMYFAVDVNSLDDKTAKTFFAIISAVIMTVCIFRKKEIKGECTVEAVFAGKSFVFSAASDSGAVVKDNLGRGVIIADETIFGNELEVLKTGKTRIFRINTAAGRRELTGIMPDRLILTNDNNIYEAAAYILIADGISLDGAKALLGRGIKMEKIKEKKL